MKYTVKGTLVGRPISVTFGNSSGRPKLIGDEVAIEYANVISKRKEGQAIGPVGCYDVTTKHLEDPLAALFLLTEYVFTTVESVSGEVPQAPQLDDGAIG
jgi:hypothetical protein